MSEKLKKRYKAILKKSKGLPTLAELEASEKKTSKTITEADVEVFIPEIISNDAEAMKLHKFEVNYRPSQSAKKCKNCTFFLRGKCKIVAGEIKPEYVCDKWRA